MYNFCPVIIYQGRIYLGVGQQVTGWLWMTVGKQSLLCEWQALQAVAAASYNLLTAGT